ncbi:MAG TPA: hypothetical protein VH988_32460 [Thermoanaerobaculia bacterium]|nr:hypothetical protein [Thermoanaerobaculia bacterium]
MSSLSLRNAATAVVLSTVLCLAAVPANAQPRNVQEPSRVEVSFTTRVWLWLTRISVLAGPSHHSSQERSLSTAATSTTDASSPTVLSRAGAFDPNG